ncbi:hypothetical protein KAR91_85155 [Candidatus Pacearchaeota archaeon]|nr:hypothetical protein [Candidatus Pacearchaeota archaeon]
MITFNIQAHNNNYYCGHKPCNGHGNCWASLEADALVFTLDQARKVVTAWPGFLKIVIAIGSVPMTGPDFERELFCAGGGSWYHYPHLDRLRRQMGCDHAVTTVVKGVKICDACAAAVAVDEGNRWYDPVSGTMLDNDLVLGVEDVTCG